MRMPAVWKPSPASYRRMLRMAEDRVVRSASRRTVRSPVPAARSLETTRAAARAHGAVPARRRSYFPRPPRRRWRSSWIVSGDRTSSAPPEASRCHQAVHRAISPPRAVPPARVTTISKLSISLRRAKLATSASYTGNKWKCPEHFAARLAAVAPHGSAGDRYGAGLGGAAGSSSTAMSVTTAGSASMVTRAGL